MTQGLLTIKRDGKVAMKIVAGCSGYTMPQLVEKVREFINKGHLPTARQAFSMAKSVHFGCDSCLVIVSKKTTYKKTSEGLGPLYRDTFNEPKFNPRWNLGTADFVDILEV